MLKKDVITHNCLFKKVSKMYDLCSTDVTVKMHKMKGLRYVLTRKSLFLGNFSFYYNYFKFKHLRFQKYLPFGLAIIWSKVVAQNINRKCTFWYRKRPFKEPQKCKQDKVQNIWYIMYTKIYKHLQITTISKL